MSIFSKLGDKSWATPGLVGDPDERPVERGPVAKTGLYVFLGVLTSMFFLFAVGYRMRMMQGDWVAIDDPGLLWANTAILVIAGVMMQRAKNAARAGEVKQVKDNLTLAGVFTIAFLVGQYVAWGLLQAQGLYAVGSASTAFFMLLTGIHALHMLGGLIVWARATLRAWQGIEVVRVKLSVELCTTYWHYLLLVWLVFFTILLTT